MGKDKTEIVKEGLQELLDKLKKELDVNVEVLDMSNKDDVSKLEDKVKNKKKKLVVDDDEEDLYMRALIDWRPIVHNSMKANKNDVVATYKELINNVKKAYKCANIVAEIKGSDTSKNYVGILECLMGESIRALTTLEAYKYTKDISEAIPYLFEMIDYAKKELNK